MAINDQNQAPSSAATNDEKQAPKSYVVERVPSGFRIEKRILKVLKGLAEHRDMSLECAQHREHAMNLAT